MRHARTIRVVLLAVLMGTVGVQGAGAQIELQEVQLARTDLSQLSDREIETILLQGRVVDRENIDVGVTLPERLWLEHDGYLISAAFKHLDFERKGLTHFEKAEIGRERQGAIDDLSTGDKALDKAYEDYLAGNIDAAQSQLDKANEHFARAASKLQ